MYSKLSDESARKLLQLFTENRLTDAALQEVASQDENCSPSLEVAQDLANHLHEIWYETKDQGTRAGLMFEQIAAPVVHEKLKLSPSAAGDPDFWRWLSFSCDGQFIEIVQARYPKALPHRFEAYLSLGSPSEPGFLRYLWLRANSVYDPKAEAPYALCDRGQSDFWTSHIVRIDYGCIPSMARAFVKFVHPEPDTQRLNLKEYRALSKELTRRNANTLLELFQDEDAYDFIDSVWSERDTWLKFE